MEQPGSSSGRVSPTFKIDEARKLRQAKLTTSTGPAHPSVGSARADILGRLTQQETSPAPYTARAQSPVSSAGKSSDPLSNAGGSSIPLQVLFNALPTRFKRRKTPVEIVDVDAFDFHSDRRSR